VHVLGVEVIERDVIDHPGRPQTGERCRDRRMDRRPQPARDAPKVSSMRATQENAAFALW
jgi:hypothetical protein